MAVSEIAWTKVSNRGFLQMVIANLLISAYIIME